MSHQSTQKFQTYKTMTSEPVVQSTQKFHTYKTLTSEPVVHKTQKIQTYKTMTSEPVTTQVFSTRSVSPASPLPQVSPVSPVSPIQLSSVSNVTTLPVTAMNGSYGTMRYLVPVQQAMPQQNYMFMQQPMMQQAVVQPMMQPMVQPMVQPMYLQTLPRVNNSSSHGTEIIYQQQQQQQQNFITETDAQSSHSVFSQPSSPNKSEASLLEVEQEDDVKVELEASEDGEEDEYQPGSAVVEEVEIVNIIQQKAPSVKQKFSMSEQRETLEPTKLDTRYFGELLADVYRKNCDIHSYIFDNVSKIRGQKHTLNFSSDLKGETQEVESLIPKGANELTKQQMRYLLETRFTAEKSMRLLLSTFSSLREELMQMSEDMRRLESEKESLERDLAFKADQALQYESLIENVRESNNKLQLSLKEAQASQRSLESQLSACRSSDSVGSFKIRELEGRMRGLEKENEMLKQKLVGQSSNGNLHLKTEALTQHYRQELETLKTERDREIEKLRSQISKLQMQITTTNTTTTKSSSAESSLQLKISELLSKLEQREITIKQKEEEIRRLLMERNDSSKNVTKTIITKRYRNQYPILGLLSDDYQATSPVKEAKTIVIERTGEMIKQE
ncbi:protein POF1B isoform X2 [Poecilia latipinna]|uniref:POF1B actin binding protein n=2 Tax=Poecilia latipinna TaxID=48699 RepID=A0A3B3UT17_9TELE|nr:PREDICTED: protein POF1B isoform X2 [Poecilia latipinna]